MMDNINRPRIFKTKQNIQKWAIGLVVILCIHLIFTLWLGVTGYKLLPHYLNEAKDSSFWLLILGMLASWYIVCLGLYRFLPLAMEANSVVVNDDCILIKRLLFPSVKIPRKFKVRPITMTVLNFSNERVKSIPAVFYFSGWKSFVISTRIEGFEEINTILQTCRTGA